MKKNKMIVFSLLLAVIFCMQSVIAYAAITQDGSVYSFSGCPSSSDGKHHMSARGTCRLENRSTGESITGQGAQCKNCYMLLVSENNLFLNPSLPLGRYATADAWGYVGLGFIADTTAFAYNSSANAVTRSFVWE